MRLESSERQAASGTPDKEMRPERIELIVDGERRPLCGRNRVLLESGRFWRGYRFEHVRMPPAGLLERVLAPCHRIFFVTAGGCDVRYRADARDAKCRLARGSFCFVSRGYVLERIAWKGSRCEAIVVDVDDIGADPNPIDVFGRTDAFFDLYVGVEDVRVATLIDLMRAEIDAGCPTGSGYAEALSIALASRVASLCASAPSDERRTAMLASRQLARITDHVAKNVSDDLTIERLAAVVNMSPFHFARCFKQTTGMTPHHFVTRERILRARKLLISTDQSIGAIAMSLGFASQSHFADVYRRITGSTPRRDRG